MYTALHLYQGLLVTDHQRLLVAFSGPPGLTREYVPDTWYV